MIRQRTSKPVRFWLQWVGTVPKWTGAPLSLQGRAETPCTLMSLTQLFFLVSNHAVFSARLGPCITLPALWSSLSLRNVMRNTQDRMNQQPQLSWTFSSTLLFQAEKRGNGCQGKRRCSVCAKWLGGPGTCTHCSHVCEFPETGGKKSLSHF